LESFTNIQDIDPVSKVIENPNLDDIKHFHHPTARFAADAKNKKLYIWPGYIKFPKDVKIISATSGYNPNILIGAASRISGGKMKIYDLTYLKNAIFREGKKFLSEFQSKDWSFLNKWMTNTEEFIKEVIEDYGVFAEDIMKDIIRSILTEDGLSPQEPESFSYSKADLAREIKKLYGGSYNISGINIYFSGINKSASELEAFLRQKARELGYRDLKRKDSLNYFCWFHSIPAGILVYLNKTKV
jgi:hypothetical protein